MRDFRRLSFHTRTKHRRRMNWNRFVASRVLLRFVSTPVILIFITQASYFEVGVRSASPFNNLRLSRTEDSYILMLLVLALIIASSTASSVASTFILSGKTVFFSRRSLFSTAKPALWSQQNRLRMLMLSERLYGRARIKFYAFVCDTRRPGMWVDIIPSMPLLIALIVCVFQ